MEGGREGESTSVRSKWRLIRSKWNGIGKRKGMCRIPIKPVYFTMTSYLHDDDLVFGSDPIED